jgi:hypothetical protein
MLRCIYVTTTFNGFWFLVFKAAEKFFTWSKFPVGGRLFYGSTQQHGKRRATVFASQMLIFFSSKAHTWSLIHTLNTFRIKNLSSVTAKYGVHFVDEGYRTLATKCLECLKQLIRRAEGEPEKKGKPTVFFWRGFRSLQGSVRARTIPGMSSHDGGGSSQGLGRGGASAARGRSRGISAHWQFKAKAFHPYRRW